MSYLGIRLSDNLRPLETLRVTNFAMRDFIQKYFNVQDRWAFFWLALVTIFVTARCLWIMYRAFTILLSMAHGMQ